MPTSRVHNLKTFEEILEEQFAADPAFREEWERLALAREVANELIRFRAKHELSQRGLAKLLGVSQPRVAELESGEKNPTIETLVQLSRATGLEFAIDVAPADREPRLVVKRVRDRRPATVHGDVSVLVAAR
jgi:DNA-binding XRE family transcriptional regulator